MLAIPASFAAHVRRFGGDAGAAWLQRLPALLAHYAQRWELSLTGPVPNLSYNYVATGQRADGAPVILKVGLPRDELRTEAEALAFWAGRGAVTLLDADPDEGVLLLARLIPGTLLAAVADDDRATGVIADVMAALHRPAPTASRFPSVMGQVQRNFRAMRSHFAGGTGPLPADLVTLAEDLATSLTPTGPPVLLHGDLHHDNILDAGPAGWLAIDPKGLVGDRAFEPYAALYNPVGWSLDAKLRQLDRRVQRFASALGLPARAIAAHSFVKLMQSAWWSIEDGDPGWHETIQIASALHPYF